MMVMMLHRPRLKILLHRRQIRLCRRQIPGLQVLSQLLELLLEPFRALLDREILAQVTQQSYCRQYLKQTYRSSREITFPRLQ